MVRRLSTTSSVTGNFLLYYTGAAELRFGIKANFVTSEVGFLLNLAPMTELGVAIILRASTTGSIA